MAYAENLGSYWRGRYKEASGKYATVRDGDGRPIHFRTRRDAERAANDAEAKARSGKRAPAKSDRLTFGAYADVWYARQDLAASTMQNYRRRLEEHLLPEFEHHFLDELTRDAVAVWEKKEKAKGYAESSIRSWRSLLHLVLADAEEDGRVDGNVAAKRKGRGKRAGRSGDRGEEKTITTALGVLLIAERAALLSGRDDEFVAVVTEGFTGIRWGELVGLEVPYVRKKAIRVEWQLYELDNGRFERCPPKDGSRRTVAVPDFLDELLSQHLKGTVIKPCPCHGFRYVFRAIARPSALSSPQGHGWPTSPGERR